MLGGEFVAPLFDPATCERRPKATKRRVQRFCKRGDVSGRVPHPVHALGHEVVHRDPPGLVVRRNDRELCEAVDPRQILGRAKPEHPNPLAGCDRAPQGTVADHDERRRRRPEPSVRVEQIEDALALDQTTDVKHEALRQSKLRRHLLSVCSRDVRGGTKRGHVDRVRKDPNPLRRKAVVREVLGRG